MSERDLQKLFENYEGEVNLSDFTVDELKEKINEVKNTTSKQTISKQTVPQKTASKKSAKEFKEKYFDYYDDVKSPSLKKQDW